MDAPLKVGTSGPKVKELVEKLTKAGFLNNSPNQVTYTDTIKHAVEAFQGQRGLHIDGIFGTQTLAALDEAQWTLGDRDIASTTPMMRGDDIATLQKILGQLGFNAGMEDSIFGPDTEQALMEFQTHYNLKLDKICGVVTIDILKQISQRARGENIASVKDRERLRSSLSFKKIFLAQVLPPDAENEVPDLQKIFDDITAQLKNFEVEYLKSSDPSKLAKEASQFEADVCLALRFSATPEFFADYFATQTYESAGGKQLATLLATNIPPILFGNQHKGVKPRGKRSQILQETKMWTVFCVLGSYELILRNEAVLVKAFSEALTLWIKDT